MKRTFTYIRNCLIDYYSQQEIESFISIIFNDIYNYSKNEIILNANKKLDDVEFIKIKTIVERLVNQEPIQYILGSTQFYDLTFFVNPAVLIPRNETEELVDLILKNHAQKKIKVLDVGTGSGCIPISIKKNNPLADLYSCDISERAIEVAKKNAELNKVNVSFFQFDILSNHPFPGKNFDVIVSNPPYVTEKGRGVVHSQAH